MKESKKKAISILLSMILLGGVSALTIGCAVTKGFIREVARGTYDNLTIPTPLRVHYETSLERTREASIRVLKEMGYEISGRDTSEKGFFKVSAKRGEDVHLEVTLFSYSNKLTHGAILSPLSSEEGKRFHQRVMERLQDVGVQNLVDHLR